MSIGITSLGEERAFLTFVRFALVWFCSFPLSLGDWEGLRLVIVVLPGLLSYLFTTYKKEDHMKNIGIIHGFACIYICRGPWMLFEHEAARADGPGKFYCNEMIMDDRCSCKTYDSNGKLWRKRPKAPYKLHMNSSNATPNQHGS